MPSNLVETSKPLQMAVRGVDQALASFCDINAQIKATGQPSNLSAHKVMLEAQAKLYGLPEVLQTLGTRAQKVVAECANSCMLANRQLADLAKRAAETPREQVAFLEKHVPPTEARAIVNLGRVPQKVVEAYGRVSMSQGNAPSTKEAARFADLPKEQVRTVLKAPLLKPALAAAFRQPEPNVVVLPPDPTSKPKAEVRPALKATELSPKQKRMRELAGLLYAVEEGARELRSVLNSALRDSATEAEVKSVAKRQDELWGQFAAAADL
jgi:hypothetical protein